MVSVQPWDKGDGTEMGRGCDDKTESFLVFAFTFLMVLLFSKNTENIMLLEL